MAEYGNAVLTRGPEELQPDQLLSIHRLLQYNFDRSKAKILKETGVDLGEQWNFRVGPMTPAHEWVSCSACDGLGTRWNGCGCGRGVKHIVDCGTRPPACAECDGMGGVQGAVIPGVYDHSFAWYVDTDAVKEMTRP